MTKREKTENTLWTRDFTILTAGSVVSMLGNSFSGFAMSLMVLDYTESTMLYAVFLAAFTLPQIIMPIFSGAILDRFSRKKTIYTLDFLSAGLYLLVSFLLSRGLFSFPFFALYCFVLGSIQSIYIVAYESFYPLLITEGNYSKAYSVSSVLEALTAVMVPVSAFLYDRVGLPPLLAVNGLCFFAAAVMETRIRQEESYIESQREASEGDGLTHGRRMLRDIREGFRYLRGEKGLMAVAAYFTFSALAGGASGTVTLPYFNASFEYGRYVYILVGGMLLLGRAVGGAVHYRIRLPKEKKFAIALTVYISISVLEAVYLFFPVPVMMLMNFALGLGGITSYTIRVSATQSWVPDEKKGRFNGAFQMLSTVGQLGGELLAGALAEVFPLRAVLCGAMLMCAAAAVVFIGGNRTAVAEIYNREQ